MTTIQNLIKTKQRELDRLVTLESKYPAAIIHYSASGMIYSDPSVNKEVDSFEIIAAPDKYGFYLTTEEGYKIYAHPAAVQVKHGNSSENDWLGHCLTINPKVIIELMTEINSKYLKCLDIHARRFPLLVEWVVRYAPDNYGLNYIDPHTLQKVKEKIAKESLSKKLDLHLSTKAKKK